MKMNEPYETIEYRDYKIQIHIEDFPESPREWDNLGAMICFHGRYNLGDEHNLEVEDLLEEVETAAVALPLYLYDHSSISMSTSRQYPFNCPWDSSQVGYIYVTKEEALSNYDSFWKYLTKRRIKKIKDYLQSEVDIYDQYLRGEVYGYIVENKEGEDIDSCWGFYDKEYMVQQAKDGIDYQIKTTWQQLELMPC